MVEPQSDHRSRRVNAAVAEYLESVEQGAPPEHEAFLAQHAEVAVELRQFFNDYRALELAAGYPLGGPAATLSDVSTGEFLREFDDFELLEEIARGGMGVVFKAHQKNPSRIVALKMILAGQLASKVDVDRFFAEAQAAATLDHPNIVPIFEVGEQNGQHYFTMGYVAGESLAQRLARDPLPAEEAAAIIRDVSLAVQYAHDKGIIHRDLKPANILMDADGRVRVTDFGLAKWQGNGAGITCTGQVLGTPNFMPPEQVSATRAELGPAADVYALGATLYALVTGRPPFQSASTLDTMQQVMQKDPVPPREFDPSIPRDLETIALKCLAKAPTRRYASAQELADDLARFLSDRPILARRSTSVERFGRWGRRNPAVAALLVAAAASLLAAVAILTIGNAHIRREAAAKDAALATARQAVDQMLMRVANEKLSHMPLGHLLREALLQDALQFYEGFLAHDADDAHVRENMAAVLNSMGFLQRELGRCDEASRSFERSIALLQSMVPTDPHPPAIREKLVETQEALAYTWQINPTDSSGQEADAHYRRTFQMYQDLERDWPERRQPVVLCLRRLAESAFRRGDRAVAERFWRQSITKGEAYLEQQPGNTDARSNLCWSCAALSDAILMRSQDRAAEAEPILSKGLQHVAIALQQQPRSGQARDVAAFLHFRLGQCYCRTGRGDDAIALFRQAIEEIESLCVEFPWYRPHWDNAIYIHNEVVWSLQSIGREDDARDSWQSMAAWLRKIAPQLPDEPVPQTELLRCRDALIARLRSTGHEKDANELEQYVQSQRKVEIRSNGENDDAY